MNSLSSQTQTSEASKLLEAALVQMDGIIQGARFEVPGYGSPGPMFNVRSPSVPVSEALKSLYTSIQNAVDGSSDLIELDTDIQEFVFNWLKNNLMVSGLKVSLVDDSDVTALEEKLVQAESERDNLILEVGVLSEQSERQSRRIQDLEKMIAAKKDMLRHTEQALERERQTSSSRTNVLTFQAEAAQYKQRCEILEKENSELRKLVGGDRTPKYLPISPPKPVSGQSPMSSASDDSSPVGRREIGFPVEQSHLDIVNTTPSPARPPKGFKKIFGKIKRSNSGGHLAALVTSPPAEKNSEQSPSKRSNTPEPFRRGGLRATAAGRLGWSNDKGPLVRISTQKPFKEWKSSTIGLWMEAMGLKMYVGEMQRTIGCGEQMLKMNLNDLESRLGVRDPMHRKKLYLAMLAKQGPKGIDVGIHPSNDNDAVGQLDHYWVTRWLDDVGLPQYKEIFFDARVDGRVLNVLTIEDLLAHLKISNQLHHLSIKRGIQALRLQNFDPDCLHRRALPSENSNGKCDSVELWTNHRVMDWLRQVDLSEYAPNLRGSGVHGALMVFEPRFNDELLAALLSIPSSKTLLRRHLSIHFKELVGRDVMQEKRDVEHDPTFVPLTPTAKAKAKPLGQFSLKRKKSKSQFDFEDLLCPFPKMSETVKTCPK